MSDKDREIKTYADVDNEEIIKFNENLKFELDREAKMLRHFRWRGNKLPPFAIEPMPFERQRLEKEMTAEDRRLRKQWLDDQVLAPNEPIFIPELYPRNPIKRILGKPWDVVFEGLKPILGEERTFWGRYVFPKIVIAIGVAYGLYYYGKYNPSRWTDTNGLHVYTSKEQVFDLSKKFPTKLNTDFYDKGFKARTTMREGKTSFNSETSKPTFNSETPKPTI